MSAEERVQALKKASPNGWVAFDADETKVVAYGQTYDEVVSAAESFGVSDPLLVKVPKDWTATVMGA
jgi:hypothetical protein